MMTGPAPAARGPATGAVARRGSAGAMFGHVRGLGSRRGRVPLLETRKESRE